MAVSGVEPQVDSADPAIHLVAYLDYYRGAVARKVAGLTQAQSHTSQLPSGWTPIELINHLVHMERRWFVWGFLAEPVQDPWGDHAAGADGHRWETSHDVTARELIERLHAGGKRTTAILTSFPLDTAGALGGRFATEPTPRLLWIGFHVLQEYARHTGHLDVSRELADGATGE